jgi:hypothetical protein
MDRSISQRRPRLLFDSLDDLLVAALEDSLLELPMISDEGGLKNVDDPDTFYGAFVSSGPIRSFGQMMLTSSTSMSG